MSHLPAPDRLLAAYRAALAALLAERNTTGHWVGELSTSALSTATAVGALALVSRHSSLITHHLSLITGGLAWLAAHQNADGGWGDTVNSVSNISTTVLCRAAFHIAGAAGEYADCLRRADAYLRERFGPTTKQHVEAVRARYGEDRTFSVPILMTCALAGLVEWRQVPPLPFELACFPQSWFRFLRLQVVSYALPALIAIGQAVYHHRPPWNPFTRIFRALSRKRSLRVLEAIQPSSGGFLEAVPLTSFVTMALASIGQAEHRVAHKAVEFLVHAVRPDGSWPIDSNLSVWVTTLSVNALAAAGELPAVEKCSALLDWLIDQQFDESHPSIRTERVIEAEERAWAKTGPMPPVEDFKRFMKWVRKQPERPVRHPYTGAELGSWGWTHLPGSVPDADDTAGALLAISNLDEQGSDDNYDSAQDAVYWLFGLQNPDGGWPTFCRGWGRLAFDRSGADLTAHAVRALAVWQRRFESPAGMDSIDYQLSLDLWPIPLKPVLYLLNRAFKRAVSRGLRYITRQQRSDGSWLPLWFGNQHAPNDENPTYGTARVLAAYRDLDMMDTEPARRGVAWLLSAQNADGGWGGALSVPSSIEETALAVEVLLDAKPPAVEEPVNKGLAWLVEQVEAGGLQNATPIGFYFAKLWYFERLYPIIFTVAALGRACRKLSTRHDQDSGG